MSKVEKIIKEIELADEIEIIEYDFTECYALMRNMEAAMVTFVKRVEDGTIRSKKTYKEFKEILMTTEAEEVVNIYEEALQVWGINSQIHKASEELFELGVAMHHWYDDKSEGPQLAEEIADVEIVCAQLRSLVGNNLVDDIKIGKLTRLRKMVDSAQKKTGSC